MCVVIMYTCIQFLHADDSSSDDRDSNDAENGKKFPSLNSLVDSAKGGYLFTFVGMAF